ncbi:hypothetical protein ACLB2K_077499 [Fragaria x ananassa]
MLRRKPTKIELKIEDKEELEEARQRAAAAAAASTTTAAADAAASTTAASTVLSHLDRSKDPSSKTHRITGN